MAEALQKLPSILIVGVLVGIFVALRRHARSTRLLLWTVAWLLIFIHFLVQIFETGSITPFQIALGAVDLASLQLSAFVFIASLSSFFQNKKRTARFLVLMGLPVIGFSVAAAMDVKSSWPYILSLGTIYFGGALFVLLNRRPFFIGRLFWALFAAFCGALAVHNARLNDYGFGLNLTLAVGFGFPGLLFWMRYRRWSPGVITCIGGFLLWASVFPLGTLLDGVIQVNPELWNTPKFFVAVGMLMTLLEDKSAVLELAGIREHKLNDQLQRFASITSRLLTGVDAGVICNEIAQAITETSTFRRAIILLRSEDNTLHLAGQSGLSPEVAALLNEKCRSWKVTDVVEFCGMGRKLGQNSYLLKPEQVEKYNPLRSQEHFEPNPYWANGYELIVPLQSTRGSYVGLISLDDPRDVSRVRAEEMSKIELLAGDLAVTMDNSTLHRQLVRSEKLAAIGQLVAGVAHELNNPLASIVGYSELMTDDIPEGPARSKLDKLIRESQRMKRIIENLLRFARQNNLERKSASLNSLLQDVISLREYHLRNNDVVVQLELQHDLPYVALDEDQFKQILLNLLNNSVDALEHAPVKRIRVEAERQENRVIVRFEDSGPGFAEPNRAFDPFYTTKPVGKGTGLGLSICYGIVKEHGGEIYAVNLQPHGARVVLELPASTSVAAAEAVVR